MEISWRRRERQTKTLEFFNEFKRDCGGGGSRTRVRKHVVVGLYMRVRFVIVRPVVWKRLSTARP